MSDSRWLTLNPNKSLAYARPWVRDTTYSLQGFLKFIPIANDPPHWPISTTIETMRRGKPPHLTLLAEDFVDFSQETVDFATPVPLSVVPDL